MDKKIMLSTYADSLGENLEELNSALEKYFSKAVKGVHILPFFPSSGDRGFAPLRYDVVEKSFGGWEDIEKIAKNHPIMADFMINHISKQSPYFKDFEAKKEDSLYRDFFIRYKDFWEKGEPTQQEVDKIYKRKPRAPYIDVNFADGTTEKVWCTFGEEQIDLNLRTEFTKQYVRDTLNTLADHGVKIIRLDAFAYAMKKAGSSCFFVEPDMWELLEWCADICQKRGVEILPEIHEHYKIQFKLVDKGYAVYDFALPMLALHALHTGETEPLTNWLNISPPNQLTTLDTHDGIGVVDVEDLLTPEQIDITKELLFTKGANVKKIYNTEAYNNLDIYQLNCTYYSALGDNDEAYLTARAIQFFAQGTPQVYYVGMMAGKNDLELLERTKEGRNINRHNYTLKEIEKEVKRDVVKKLLELMAFRNSHPVFEGEGFEAKKGSEEGEILIERTHKEHKVTLKANVKNHTYEIIEG